MTDILVRDLDETIAARLKAKAAAANTSVAQYLRDLIAQDVGQPLNRHDALALAASIRAETRALDQPAGHLVREDRDGDYGNDWRDDLRRP